jgi:hypothetical protein
MLEKNIELKIRKDNLYVLIDKYKLTTLEVDLYNSVVSIWVDFYRAELFILRRKFDFGEKGDIDVNSLIKQLHERIINGV